MRKKTATRLLIWSYSMTLLLLVPPKPVKTDSVHLKPVPGLFDSDDILQLKLTGNTRALLGDRESADPQYFPFQCLYTDDNGIQKTLKVDIKTRGHFRRMRENCTYPPLLIRFSADSSRQASLFRDQGKLKLVMPCAGEDLVIREWLVYKIYNLVTPMSFRARLVKIQMVDERSKKEGNPVTGMLLEEEDEMAKRNQASMIETKLRPQNTDQPGFLTMAIFQFLIGNTDWSVEYQQNIKLIVAKTGSLPIPVAYDFDHAGIVNAPYAKPAEELLMSSIRERRFRGYCISDPAVFYPVIDRYKELKNDIYKLYTDCRLIDEKYLKSTTRFLDEFYATLNNPKAWQKAFAYPCDKNGTGNVIIKGLKEN